MSNQNILAQLANLIFVPLNTMIITWLDLKNVMAKVIDCLILVNQKKNKYKFNRKELSWPSLPT